MAMNRESESEPKPKPEEEEPVGTEEDDESSKEEGSEEEEEVEESSNEEEGSEEEEVEEAAPLPKILPVSSGPEKVPNAQSSSEDEDEVEDEDEDEDEKKDEESDSESYDLVKKTDPSIPSAQDEGDLTKSKKPTSPAKPGAKRVAEKEAEVKDTKKLKKKPDSTVEEGENNNSAVKGPSAIDDSKKQLFQRLWSEEDEIVILKGMLDYAAKKNADPVSDISAFLEYIKQLLHIEVTKTQLHDKVRRLKRKFVNHASKEKVGKERVFSKSHDQMVYELSKKIWGKSNIYNGNVGNEIVLHNPNASVTVARKSGSNVEVEDHLDVETVKSGCSLGSSLSYSSVAEWILKDGAKLMDRQKREEMEEKLTEIQMQEVEVFLKRTEFMCEQTKLVLEAMRKSKQ